MWDTVFGVIGLIGLLIGVLWLIGLPGDDDKEELAGYVTANWDRIKDQIEHH
jgi:ABC-type transporter Mla subunit MlaD